VGDQQQRSALAPRLVHTERDGEPPFSRENAERLLTSDSFSHQ
jgi:hypothetical protein